MWSSGMEERQPFDAPGGRVGIEAAVGCAWKVARAGNAGHHTVIAKKKILP